MPIGYLFGIYRVSFRYLDVDRVSYRYLVSRKVSRECTPRKLGCTEELRWVSREKAYFRDLYKVKIPYRYVYSRDTRDITRATWLCGRFFHVTVHVTIIYDGMFGIRIK